MKIPQDPIVETFDAGAFARLIVIGDPHGCLHELSRLHDRLRITFADLVVVVGDLVDRGPESAATVRFVQGCMRIWPNNYRCTLGNHEEKHVRYRAHELKRRANPAYVNPMKMYDSAKLADNESLSDDEIAFLAGLPAAVKVTKGEGFARERTITHAGLLRGQGLRQPTKALIRNRYIRRTGHDTWAPEKFGPGFSQPEGTVNWDEVYDGSHGRVIYGHQVHSLETPRVLNDCYGIDTGCCFGGRLTAYVEDLKTGEVSFVQEQAAEAYFVRGDVDE